MMLSELYGRIGQMLREHGDAPIADLRKPMPDDHLLGDLYRHKHVNVVFCKTQLRIGRSMETLKTYNLTIEEELQSRRA